MRLRPIWQTWWAGLSQASRCAGLNPVETPLLELFQVEVWSFQARFLH